MNLVFIAIAWARARIRMDGTKRERTKRKERAGGCGGVGCTVKRVARMLDEDGGESG